MLILITGRKKVIFKNKYSSNIVHDITTYKIPFLSLWPREGIFLKLFFMYARQIPVQTKVHFQKLQFLAVTYNMAV